MQDNVDRSADHGTERKEHLFTCPARLPLDCNERQHEMRREKYEFKPDVIAAVGPGYEVTKAARSLFYALCGARGPNDLERIQILSQGSIEKEVLFWKDLKRWPRDTVSQCVEGLFGNTPEMLAAFIGFESMGGFQEYIDFETFITTLNSSLSSAGMCQETISLLLNDAAAHFVAKRPLFEAADGGFSFAESR